MSTIAPVPSVPVDDDALAAAIDLADRFIAGTNELDSEARTALIESTWVPDGHFIDPLHEASGHAEMEALFQQVHINFPGYVFSRTGEVERLDRWFRFTWDFRGEDGSLLAAGTDTAEIGADGRLVRIVSFYDHLESD